MRHLYNLKSKILLALIIAPFAMFGQNPTDACGAGVATLTSNAACVNTAYTLAGGYANGGQLTAAGCTAGNDRDDGWYQFVATGTSTTVQITGDEARTIAAYTGSCGTGQLACNQAAAGNTASITFATTCGTTYYLQVHRRSGNNNATMTGNICVFASGACPGSPANDLCANATALPCGTTNLAGTTVNATNLADGTGCTISDYGVWYSFVGDGTSTTISSTANGWDHEMAISYGSCGAQTNLSCNDAAFTSGTETTTFVSTLGVTYYVYIGHWSSTSTTTGPFTITRTCVAPTCSDGIQNQGETGIDCGGPCPACPAPTCSDGIQNQGETGIDCGGPCPACPAVIQPTACSTISQTILSATSYKFYDDGGVGGDNCADQTGGGNYCNCNCFTITTICAPAGEFIVADFNEFAMWNTTSGWDWMRIYDNNTTAGTVLYDNSSTGPDNPFGDCGQGATVMTFCSTNECLTFEFWATSVVNRAGWDCDVTSTNIACTLPVEFLSFSGENEGISNALTWTTASEINNDYFIVEASSNNMESFSAIGVVDGSGNSNTEITYEFIDNNVTSDITYYRLRQFDFDGESDISSIIAVRSTRETISFFPNPAQNELKLNVSNVSSGSYRIVYTNILGSIVEEQIVIEKGASTYQLDEFNNLSTGVYFVQVIAQDGTTIGVDKVIKE